MTDDTTPNEQQQHEEAPPQDLGYGPQELSSRDDTCELIKEGQRRDSSHRPQRGVERRLSNLPERGLAQRFSMRIPANQDAAHTAAETHGYDHWKVKVMHFLHSDKIQLVLMLLLLADVVILFIELYLQATYPNCHIVKRDAISCCPIEGAAADWNATAASHTEADEHFRRFLAGEEEDGGHGGGGGDEHHNLCDYPGEESFTFDATCDPHKWQSIHTLEKVLFGFTVTILSIFLLELTSIAIILQKAFFRQLFYVLDLFIVLTSLILELTFHFLHEDLLTSLAGLLIFFRIWRFIRIGHGLIEVTAEYAHHDKEILVDYAESLEEILETNGIALPEVSKRVRHIKKKLEEDRNHTMHNSGGSSKKEQSSPHGESSDSQENGATSTE